MAWYRTGEQAQQYADQREKENEAKYQTGEWWQSPYCRLWLPVGGEVEVTFVDPLEKHPEGYALPWVIDEHQIKVDGDWKHWSTCIREMTPADFIEIFSLQNDPEKNAKLKDEGIDPDAPLVQCPACNDGDNCSVISAYTVIDHSEFEDKKGNRRKDELKLLIAKTKTFKLIKKQQKRRGSLRGLRFEISRLTKDSPNAGDNFEFIGENKISDKIQPAPYHLVFKPRTPKAMIEYFQLATTEYTDEDIPF